MTGRRPPLGRLSIAALTIIIAGGAALRFFRLTFQSLWLDELFSVIISRSDESVAEIIRVYTTDVHPLVYPLLLHCWLMVFGDGDFAARSLSALLGVIGIWVVYSVGRRIGGPGLGATVALLTAVNAFHIAYSQEARSYTLVFVCAAMSYGALVWLLHRPGWWVGITYGLITATAIHVHYYALVMLLGQVAAACAVLGARRAPWREWRPLLLSMAVISFAVLPWLGPVRRVAALEEYWPAVPKPLFFVDYFHAYFGEELVLSVIFGGLLVAMPLLVRRRTLTAVEEDVPSPAMVVWVLAASVAVSLVVAYLRSVWVVPMLMPRFTLVFLPAILLLIAMALCRLRPPLLRTVTVLVVVLVSIAGLVRTEYYTKPRKEQWREAVQQMMAHPAFDQRSDRCLAAIAPGFQYYVDQQGVEFSLLDLEIESLQTIADQGSPRPALWVLLARKERPDAAFRELQRLHWQRTDRIALIKTTVERWEPLPEAEE